MYESRANLLLTRVLQAQLLVVLGVKCASVFTTAFFTTASSAVTAAFFITATTEPLSLLLHSLLLHLCHYILGVLESN